MANKTLDFDKSFKCLKYIYFCLGLNIQPDKSDNRIIKRCVYILNCLWLNSDVLSASYYIIQGVKNGTDMTALTYIAPCNFIGAVATFKSINLIVYEDYANKLIDKLRKLNEHTIDSHIAVKNEIARSERKFLDFVINLLNIFNIGMVINFAFSPMILIAIKYIKTRKLELILPFLDVYQFDALNIKYWPLIYAKQIWSECVVHLGICGADYLFYIFCTNIRIQFRQLSHELENFIPDQQTNGDNFIDNHRDKFLKIIKWHQDLIKSTETLEAINTKSTLFHFMSSSVIICLTGFNVTAIDNIGLAVPFLIFLTMSLLQIFFLCLFGDMIMTSSVEVSDAVYNSLWYSADGKIAKDLLLILTRAQKPCKLTALRFADVNLRAFTKIISTSWSYFALLQTMYTTNQE